MRDPLRARRRVASRGATETAGVRLGSPSVGVLQPTGSRAATILDGSLGPRDTPRRPTRSRLVPSEVTARSVVSRMLARGLLEGPTALPSLGWGCRDVGTPRSALPPIPMGDEARCDDRGASLVAEPLRGRAVTR